MKINSFRLKKIYIAAVANYLATNNINFIIYCEGYKPYYKEDLTECKKSDLGEDYVAIRLEMSTEEFRKMYTKVCKNTMED